MEIRQAYPSDLTRAEWAQVARFIPAPKPGGRPAKYDRREIVDALLYISRTGCQWRALSHDLPPWAIVYWYFRCWKKDGTLGRHHRQPVGQDDRKLRPRDRLRLEIRAKEPGPKEFKVIPLHWRVERTFAWLGRWRRLSKNYEGTTSSSEAMIKLAMIDLMGRRLGRVDGSWVMWANRGPR